MVGETDDKTLQNNVQTDHEVCRLRRQEPVGHREKLSADLQDQVLISFFLPGRIVLDHFLETIFIGGFKTRVF
jgi:hypothetical protein